MAVRSLRLVAAPLLALALLARVVRQVLNLPFIVVLNFLALVLFVSKRRSTFVASVLAEMIPNFVPENDCLGPRLAVIMSN